MKEKFDGFVVCSRCKTPCCRHVKHMPYQGEIELEPYENILLGAFPPLEPDELSLESVKRIFVAEWIIPAELSACMAYTSEGKCSIYDSRPIACQNFPLVQQDKLHEFCPFRDCFKGQQFIAPGFLDKIDHLDLFLYYSFLEGGEDVLSDILLEERPFEAPLFYNGYLVLILLIAGVDPVLVLKRQKKLIINMKNRGLKAVTAIIPGTEYCIEAQLEGLYANLEYLIYRLVDEKRLNSFMISLDKLSHSIALRQ